MKQKSNYAGLCPPEVAAELRRTIGELAELVRGYRRAVVTCNLSHEVRLNMGYSPGGAFASESTILGVLAERRHRHATFGDKVSKVLTDVAELLRRKNKSYGNSALEPMGVFSRAPATEQIQVRIDDKLSRIRNGLSSDEDTVLDLIGYLVLLRIAQDGG